MNKNYLAILLNSKIFNIILIFDIIICTILNYKADVMGPMVVLYQDFANFFSSGFDLSAKFIYGHHTFPMWGYGLVLLITKNKLLIVIFQQLLTLYTIIFIDYTARKYIWFKSILLFRILILLSFNWFFFHTSVWPYSIGANLLVLAICKLIIFFQTGKKISIVTSAVLFGIFLNLRSDYYYFTFFIFALLFLLKNFKQLSFKFRWLVVWILLIHLLLVPWGIYTYKRTGTYLQTSTNAGHVFFISLGQLPNNTWGITQEDTDPEMYKLLYERFGKNTNSLHFNEDIYLKGKWKEYVTQNPKEFIKKCLFNTYRIIRNPFYPGSIEKTFYDKLEIEKAKTKMKECLDSFNFIGLAKILFTPSNLIFLISAFFNLFGMFVLCLFFYYLIKILFIKGYVFYKDILFVISVSLIIYQISMLIFAFFLPIYHTNIYLFYLLSIVNFKDKIQLLQSNKSLKKLDC